MAGIQSRIGNVRRGDVVFLLLIGGLPALTKVLPLPRWAWAITIPVVFGLLVAFIVRLLKRKGEGGRPSVWEKLGRSNKLFPRKLKFTKEGKLLIGITLGIGFAAINTGNNLMYLVLGMLLSLMIVSGIMSELTLRHVVVKRVKRGPLEVAKDEFFSFRVHNGKRWFVSYCVEVEEIVDGGTQLSGYALRLAPGEETEVRVRLRLEERGVRESVGFSISTRFPFSFFRKSRFIPIVRELVVHPPIKPVLPLRDAPDRDGSEHNRSTVGRGEETYGIKDYQQGDSPRDIHWKATARRHRLMAREYEAPGNRTVWIGLRNVWSKDLDGADFEEAVTYTASLLSHLLESGCAVGLVTHDGVIPPDGGGRHRMALLIHLARLKRLETAGPLPVGQCGNGRKILIQPQSAAGTPGEAWDQVRSPSWPEEIAA